MQHRGSCHCGRIVFELDEKISNAIDCNCSMCRRRGGLLAFFPRTAFRLLAGEGEDAIYRFNRGHIDHHFCPNCGIAPFSEGVDPASGAKMVAVNIRCVDDLDLSTVEIRPFDGAKL